MNGRERVYSLISGNAADRAAVINPVSNATAESCRALGIRFADAHSDAAAMAALAAYAHENLGFDSVMPYFSVTAEAAALGAEIDWGGNNPKMPTAHSYVVKELRPLAVPEGYLAKPALAAVINAVRILKKRCKDAFLIGKAIGPWTLCLKLFGDENTLIATLDDPAALHTMMDSLCGFTRLFVTAQLEAGADAVTIADHCARNLVGPDAYREFLLPLHKKLCAEFPKRLILHCCGNVEDRVSDFAKAGFLMYHFESANPIEKMLSSAKGMPLTGCVNNPAVLLKHSPKQVQAECTSILRAGIRLLSPECAVPLETRNENLRSLVKAAAEFGHIPAIK